MAVDDQNTEYAAYNKKIRRRGVVMKPFPLIIIIMVTLVVILLLARQPVYDVHQCQDPGHYKWQYGRDVCLPGS